ncbi:MAG: thioredoxin family protein [Vampirovibrionales bacterium]|nr:thioredoxin family protein [Vampirovibrionales bacterium]
MKTRAKSQILILLGLIVLAMGLFLGYLHWSPFLPKGQDASQAEAATQNKTFEGIRPVASTETLALFPEAKGRPILLAFGSEYCIDCQRLKPILEEALSPHKKIYAIHLDIRGDQQQYPQVFEAFKPSVVPLMVFIAPDGTVRNVITGVPAARKLESELQALEQHPGKGRA